MSEKANPGPGSNVVPGHWHRLAFKASGDLREVEGRPPASEDPPIGAEARPKLVNPVVWLDTDRPPDEPQGWLRDIEGGLGRRHCGRTYAPCRFDLDICLCCSRLDHNSAHPLPEPELPARPFMAVDVAEVAPAVPHPVTRNTVCMPARHWASRASFWPRPELTARLRPATPAPGLP